MPRGGQKRKQKREREKERGGKKKKSLIDQCLGGGLDSKAPRKSWAGHQTPGLETESRTTVGGEREQAKGRMVATLKHPRMFLVHLDSTVNTGTDMPTHGSRLCLRQHPRRTLLKSISSQGIRRDVVMSLRAPFPWTGK